MRTSHRRAATSRNRKLPLNPVGRQVQKTRHQGFAHHGLDVQAVLPERFEMTEDLLRVSFGAVNVLLFRGRQIFQKSIGLHKWQKARSNALPKRVSASSKMAAEKTCSFTCQLLRACVSKTCEKDSRCRTASETDQKDHGQKTCEFSEIRDEL